MFCSRVDEQKKDLCQHLQCCDGDLGYTLEAFGGPTGNSTCGLTEFPGSGVLLESSDQLTLFISCTL